MGDKNEEIKRVEVINAPRGSKYVGEFMKTLPIGVLNKVNTGCGATTLVIENDENVVICCPTIRLVTNKVAQYPNERCQYKLLGVRGGVTNREIENYLRECEDKQPIKIMVTYDSFKRVSQILGKSIHDFKIVVDESQEITNGACYRNRAMHLLLENLRGMDNVTFLSATPIPSNFLPKEIADLKHYTIDWGEQKERIRILPIHSSSPFSTAIRIILHRKLKGELVIAEQKVENLFFFVNSVSAIERIISKAGLKKEDVNIICAENTKNIETLGGFHAGEIPLEGQAHKPFTFCTKTAFCGADFHTENGLCIVVSDNRHESTVVDVAIDIKQIAGRLRTATNPFKGMILHIHDTREAQSEEEFFEELNEKIRKSEDLIYSFQNGSEPLQEVLVDYNKYKRTDEDHFLYFNKEKNVMELDQLKIDWLVYQYEHVKQTYSDSQNMQEYYEQQGYSIDKVSHIVKELDVFSRTISKSPTLEGLCTKYYRLCDINKDLVADDDKFKGVDQRILELEDIQPLLPEFYKHLSLEEIKKMRYNITDMKDEWHFRREETQEAIKREMRKRFKEGERYSNKEAKAIQQEVFDALGINKKATAKGLNKYADIQEGVKVNIDGKRLDGVQVGTIFFVSTSMPMPLFFD